MLSKAKNRTIHFQHKMSEYNESERYLGVVVAVYNEHILHGDDQVVINQFDDGFPSKYYFLCKRDFCTHRHIEKGRLVTFEIQRSSDDFYKYSAHSIQTLESDDNFVQRAISDIERKRYKYLCLIFNPQLLKTEAENNLKLLNLDYKFFDRWNPKTLLDNILENTKVIVDTWTSKRPGKDDSWGANFKSNFGDYDNCFHSYVKTFWFNKASFSDTAFASCYDMINKYTTSSAFEKDQEQAEVYSQNLRDRLKNEYDYEEHRKVYFNEITVAKNKELRKLISFIANDFWFKRKSLDFDEHYEIYFKDSKELIEGMMHIDNNETSPID